MTLKSVMIADALYLCGIVELLVVFDMFTTQYSATDKVSDDSYACHILV